MILIIRELYCNTVLRLIQLIIKLSRHWAGSQLRLCSY